MSVTHFSGPLAIGSGAIQSVTDAITLTMKDDNGKTFILGSATAGDITLPAVTNTGFQCKVVVGVDLSDDASVVSAEGDNMEGALMVASTVVTVDAADKLNFIDTADNIGDWVTVISDGTYWYCDGRALTTAAITATG
jgi:hypothetical protein